jgi:uncharacterized Zn finger protein (UPF0148 family)
MKVSPTPLIRSLDQEVLSLLRGASLECLVCGEFVLRLADGSLFCPECGCGLGDRVASEPAGSLKAARDSA